MKEKQTFSNGKTLSWEEFLDVANYGSGVIQTPNTAEKVELLRKEYEMTRGEATIAINKWAGYQLIKP